ncbi:AbgT family transporter [Cetobacterium sp. 2A]|uniref:AbgT family transporter n=1 Tax=unclassified Cetobacterium TaxID=2630983 RepID=UPI00163C4F70|nr:AbgT family transporter [Cetobacterium sp. 2A]MBC2855586.1 AbgT family transporter [Cetobacterium sp. 2A]
MSSNVKTTEKQGFFAKFLNFVEVAGNKLPHPVAMFFGFFVITIILSGILSQMGVSVSYQEISRSTGGVIQKTTVVQNLLTRSGMRGILSTVVKNFTGHAALGSIVVAMLGVGLAEGTGLMNALIKKLVLSTPKQLVSAIVVFAGVMSNVASDAGYVVLIPLGAVIFASFGRHPLAGIAAAFAGVSGGFSANLLIGTTDPLLGGITTTAAQIVLPGYSVDPTANFFFMFASTFLITIVGAYLTDKIVEPRLGAYTGPKLEVDLNSQMNQNERFGLRVTGVVTVMFICLVLAMVLPDNAILKLTEAEVAKFVADNNRQPGTMELLKPFFGDSIVFILMLSFFIPGLAYGIAAKTVKTHKDVIKSLTSAMASCGQVFVIIFISAQFVYVFTKSNIGIVIAVKLADVMKGFGISGIWAAVGLIFLTAFVNLFIGGASSKWLMLSPVFVPMFVELGLSPEYTQLAYRIGDSTTNIISPLMSYFPIIVGFAAKYAKNEEDMGIGTIIAMMLPYSIMFLIGWTIMFVAWTYLGLPIGPGVSMFL